MGSLFDYAPVLYYYWRRTSLSVSGIPPFALMVYLMKVWVAYFMRLSHGQLYEGVGGLFYEALWIRFLDSVDTVTRK